MHHKLLCFIALLFVQTFTQAQDIKEVFSSSKTAMAFVGIDFSHAKMVGSEGFSDPEKIQSYYFGVWNGLMISEADKYDVKKAFMKQDLAYNLDVVEKFNNEVDFIDLVTNSTPKSFKDEQIQSMVQRYDLSDIDAQYGIAFIVHSFNKLQEMGYIHVVIFDVKSKKVLFNKKMTGEAGGFGFRNYWARSVYNIIKDIQKSKFRKWRKELTK